jgi:release factor glutamine methyltransferase
MYRSMPFDPGQVYSPAEDTYLLLKAAQDEIRPGDRVLEVGTGSGRIATEIGRGLASCVATDINPHAAAYVHAQGIDVVQTDLCAGLRGPFDLVIFNPPYLPTQPEERLEDWLEYALDGGPDGRNVIGRFAADVRRVLAPSGRVLLLISSLTGLQEISGIFLSKGFFVAIVNERRLEDEILYVLRIA